MARALVEEDLPKDDDSYGKLKFGAKSEFVRSLDRTMPAADVVALAEQQGMKLTTGLVYNIRSMANGRGESPSRKRKISGIMQTSEAMLRTAIAEVGLVKARAILEEVEEAFSGQ